MKKIFSLGLATLLLLTSLCLLVSCGISESDILGLWTYNGYYEDKKINHMLEFRADGTYTYIYFINDEFDECLYGEYEIKGNQIKLYDSYAETYHGRAIVMSYEDGCVTGGAGTRIYDFQEGKKLSIDRDLAVLIAGNSPAIKKAVEDRNKLKSFVIMNEDGMENGWDTYTVSKSDSYYHQNEWEIELKSKISGYDYYGDFVYNLNLTVIVYVSLTGSVDVFSVFIY